MSKTQSKTQSKSPNTVSNTPSNTPNTTDLTVKDVDLFGDTVVAAQDKNGVIWAGVNYFCRGIGFTKNERDRQIKNIQADEVLKGGCVKFDAGVFDKNNETLALQLDYIPLWLAKISITPNMKESNPELVDKLVKYQLKAKDVLAAAFLPKTYSNANNNTSNSSSSNTSDSEPVHFPDKPQALDFHNTPVITTAELAKHYGIPYQNILTNFYRHKEYFEKGVHYFLLEMDEELEFRAMNGLNSTTKLYLWTKKGSLMFTKIINNDVGWKQYKRILDILFEKTYGENEQYEQQYGLQEIKKDNVYQVSESTRQLKPQSNWYLKNSYKIERICKALDMEIKEFNHLVLSKIQEKYDMASIGRIYESRNGSTPEYAMNIIDCFSELSEIADDMLSEFMLSVVDRYLLMKSITMK